LPVFDADARCATSPSLPIALCAAPSGTDLGFASGLIFEEFNCEGCSMTKPYGAISTLRRWALVPLATLALAACGGGEPDVPQAVLPPGPATFAVAAPPATPTMSGDTAGATQAGQTGQLHYMVFSASDVAAGMPVSDVATISNSGATHDITFLTTAAFAPAGLVVSKAVAAATVETWNGVSGNGGIQNLEATFNGNESGLLSDGNFLVYCSAGISSQLLPATIPALAPAARAGAQVAVSGNFVAMSDIAPLYGKTFKRFDCTDSAPSTKFGDSNGNFAMAFGAVTLAPADVVAAFSSGGFTSTTGAIYKRRAYQITIRGVTRYAIVALDRDAAGNATASVLYQFI
jgi:hypothetical protein